jgi:hypothetical protein
MALRNAFGALALEATLSSVLAAISDILHVRPPAAAPVTWDGGDRDVSNMTEVEFCFTTATGGPWTPQRRMTVDAAWQNWPVKDSSGADVTSISSTDVGKIFRMRGRGHIRLDAASGSLDGHLQEA